MSCSTKYTGPPRVSVKSEDVVMQGEVMDVV